MARGILVREWTCDACGKTERLPILPHDGSNGAPTKLDTESWRLPSGWFRIRIDPDSVGAFDDPSAEHVVEVCNRCYGVRLGELESIEERLYPSPVLDAEPAPAVDLGTLSEYEKIHGATKPIKAPKGESVSFKPSGSA